MISLICGIVIYLLPLLTTLNTQRAESIPETEEQTSLYQRNNLVCPQFMALFSSFSFLAP